MNSYCTLSVYACGRYSKKFVASTKYVVVHKYTGEITYTFLFYNVAL